MSCIGFKCMDGGRRLFAECAYGIKCPTGEGPCACPSTLAVLAEQRRPLRERGRPSVTECLRGPLEVALRERVDWFLDPQEGAFRLHGTRSHAAHAETGRALPILIEEGLGDAEEISGTLDEYDGKTLWDRKTWGSFTVAKTLGLVAEEIPDPEGGAYKSGPRKGQARTLKRFHHDPAQADYGDTLWQLNRYRISLQRAGFLVVAMRVEAIVRDGGIMVAKSRGVLRNLYVIDIPLVPDAEVLAKFDAAAKEIMAALNLPLDKIRPCNDNESWGGRKCADFCEVREHCPARRQNGKEEEA